MSDEDGATLDLHVDAHREPGTAGEDWNTLNGLVADDVIKVGALALVNRCLAASRSGLAAWLRALDVHTESAEEIPARS